MVNSWPLGIAIGPDGTVYVSDEGRDDIQRFDRDGRFLEANGEEGMEPGQFMTPAGVAVASNGDVYVADYGNKRIQHFTASGEFLGSWGSTDGSQGSSIIPMTWPSMPPDISTSRTTSTTGCRSSVPTGGSWPRSARLAKTQAAE